jgi:vancomycin permeability regulator SanA
LLSFFIVYFLIIISGAIRTKENVDIAVVLGNKVYENGVMSPVLKARVDAALTMYNNKQAKKILVSGGFGKEGYFEAEVMKDYLIKNTVPLSDVLVDNYGNSTRESAKNAAKQVLRHSCIAIATSYYHIIRTHITFRQYSFSCIKHFGSRYVAFQDIIKIPREMIAIPTYFLKLK